MSVCITVMSEAKRMDGTLWRKGWISENFGYYLLNDFQIFLNFGVYYLNLSKTRKNTEKLTEQIHLKQFFGPKVHYVENQNILMFLQ